MGLKETRKNFSQNSRCFWPRISSQICQQPYRLSQLPGTQYVHPTAQTFSSFQDFRQFLDHKCSIHLKTVCWVFYCQNFIYGFSKPHVDLDLRTDLLRYTICLLLRDCLNAVHDTEGNHCIIICHAIEPLCEPFLKKITNPLFLEKLRVGRLLGY